MQATQQTIRCCSSMEHATHFWTSRSTQYLTYYTIASLNSSKKKNEMRNCKVNKRKTKL